MSGRADVIDTVPGLAEVLADQSGVCSRAQLRALGVGWHHVSRQLIARRWQQAAPDVIVTWTGPLTPLARRWVALLHAGASSALCAWTALQEWGLRSWERERVHVVVDRGTTLVRLPFVAIHESRRNWREDVVSRRAMRVHRVERAALDVGAWGGGPRTAAGVIAAVVQQGLTTPERLMEATGTVGRVAHLRTMRLALHDIAGGAQALSEIDLARLCRRHGLPEPRRQARRRDARGRWRYLDVEWRLSGGGGVVLEVDGIGHLDSERWYDDLIRAAEVVRPGETLVRLPATAVRIEPDRVVAILRSHLGVRSTLQPAAS